MSRLLLIRLIKLMFAALLLAFLYVMFVGVSKAPMSSSSEPLAGDYASVAPGTSQLVRVAGQPAWVTHVDPVLLTKLFALSDAVGEGGCLPRLGYCVLNAGTQTQGVLASWTEAPPPQLPNDKPWIGGYVDPTNGHVFDQLGRPYLISNSADDVKGAMTLLEQIITQ